MSDTVEVIQPIVKQKLKSDNVKIKAKCKTCHRRLHTNKKTLTVVCKNGHSVSTPIEYRVPKGTVSTKPRAARVPQKA